MERAVYLLPPMYKFDVIVLAFATPGGGHRLGMWSGTAWKGETHLQSMNAFAAKLTRWPSMSGHEMRSIQRMYGFTGAGRWQDQAAICATEFGA